MPTQRSTVRRLTPAVIAFFVLGCAESEHSTSAPLESPAGAVFRSTAPTTTSATPAESPAAAKSALEGRKIIYTGQIELVTEDLTAFEDKLTKLITAQHGYVADSSRTGSSGETRQGTWKVRVPAESYAPFVKTAASLGELIRLKTDSQDVSEEFYDLEARQKAKTVEEGRLLKHLEDSTGKLDEILAVERELSRVRGEIEQMQGRLRMIANLSALATVSITASEIKDYVPPQAPTLGTRIARTFSGSVDVLSQVGESILLFIVALIPWLPFLLLGFGLTYWFARRSMRRLPRVAESGSR
jgi:hypothetical protein